MSLPLVPHKDALSATAASLELQWVDWPGSWDEFAKEVRARGSAQEIEVLSVWPEEFRSSAGQRVARIDNWSENRLPAVLENIHKISEEATKLVGKDATAHPDYSTRLAASKFLVERILGRAPEVDRGSNSELSGELNERARRRRELIDVLKDRGVKIVETERRIEVD